MKNIIFITDLTLWSMGKGHGGPAFTQTVKKYIDEGCEVYLISDEPSNMDYPNLDQEHNILIKPSIWKKYIHLRKVGIIFRYLNHCAATFKYIAATKNVLKYTGNDSIVYAYEVFGVKAGKIISKKFNIPLVTRFQGTILSQYKNNIMNRIRLYPHYQALAEPSDLVIMTDDGTQGDKVLDDVSNLSKRLFVRNGLELMKPDTYKNIVSFERKKLRDAIGILPSECMYLTVSRLVEWKRVDRAINGFADACAEGVKGKLVVVGDGSDRNRLEKLAKERGVEKHIFFIGSVPHNKVYEYMMACDVFVSLYDLSNVGNPLLEAMALGKCIITLNVGDTNKIITDGINGVLLEQSGLAQLGKVMKELAYNHSFRTQLSENAKIYAKENFCSWEERMEVEFKQVKELLRR